MQFGNVTHFDAVRQFVKDRGLTLNRVYTVQTMDANFPEEPVSSIQVVPRLSVQFLNPRQGADHGEKEEGGGDQAGQACCEQA